MTLQGLSLAAVATLGLAMPCGGGPRLPSNVGEATRTAREAKKTAADVAELNAEREKCDKISTQRVATEEEDTIGQTAALEFIRKRGLVQGASPADQTSAAARELNRLGVKLAALSERVELTWSFAILDDPTVNAFALPGGYILVTRGLLAEVENEAQLAGILAHEIGHVTNQHAVNRYRKIKANVCRQGLAGSAAAKTGVAQKAWQASPVSFIDFNSAQGLAQNSKVLQDLSVKVAMSLVEEPNTHDEEHRADEDGLKLMVAAGYPPQELGRFFARVGDDRNVSNHPPTSERAKQVERFVSRLGECKHKRAACGKGDEVLLASGHPFGPKQGFEAPPLAPALAALRGR
jgi:beta-barrel assembly-enhancing protease